jgi:two-component system, OmpR family, sensor histidine kinase KdpD
MIRASFISEFGEQTMSHFSQKLPAYALAVVLVAVVTVFMWLARDLLTLANFSLLYLFVVLLIAMRQGIGPSFLATILSFLAFNFFLVQPLYTFAIADPREVIDLIIFLVLAVLTGQLAAQARQESANARQRAYERDILFQLTSIFNQLTNNPQVYDALKTALEEHFNVSQVNILPDKDAPKPDDLSALYVLMQSGEQIFGTLALRREELFSPLQTRLINIITVQASMALQRIFLSEHARKGKEFEEADRLKTALLRAVSHDLRTPITIIKTSVSNLLNLYQQVSSEERVEMLKAIDIEADHLNKMIGNLLDMSRLQAGALNLNIRLNTFEEVAGDVAARVWQITNEERIKIAFPENMPLVPFDYGLMLQALTNIVDNALRYEPEHLQVEIRGSFDHNHACISVVNHGPNITPEERERIIEPFYHGKDGHVGLGLPIAKGIIDAHRGTLHTEDTPNGGATFVISLPLAPESVQQAP